MTMTKQQAIDWAKGLTALARRLGITHTAVCRWSDDAIPPYRELQIREIQRTEAAEAAQKERP